MALISLNITYTNPNPQYLFNKLQPSDFLMTADFDNKPSRQFVDFNEFELSSDFINDDPDCVITFSYTEDNITKTCDVKIPGYKVNFIQASYIGTSLLVPRILDPADVIVRVHYENGMKKQITTSDYVIYTNNGIVTIAPEQTMEVGILNRKYTTTFVVFTLYVLGVRAEYTGPEIFVGENFDKSNVKVKSVISDLSMEEVNIEDCLIIKDGVSTEKYPGTSVEDHLVKKNGNNKYELWYRGQEPGGRFADEREIPIWRECILTVPGKRTPIELHASYIGNKLQEFEYVAKQSVEVECRYLIDCTNPENLKYETSKLDLIQWSFQGVPIVQESNDGLLKISGEGITGTVKVPWYKIKYPPTLNVWWEGHPVYVGNHYSIKDIRPYIIDIYNEPQPILKDPSLDVIFEENNKVTQEGYNWFTCWVRYGAITLEGRFYVIGIIERKQIDTEFKVLYIIDNGVGKVEPGYEDVTEQFESLYVEQTQQYNINWYDFLEIAMRFRFGLYKVLAPIHSGFSHMYFDEWYVLVSHDPKRKEDFSQEWNVNINNSSARLKAWLAKVHHEKEDEQNA